MSDQEKEDRSEDYLSWLSHPYTRRMIPETEQRLAVMGERLVGLALESPDPRVATQAAAIMALRQTLQSLRGDK